MPPVEASYYLRLADCGKIISIPFDFFFAPIVDWAEIRRRGAAGEKNDGKG